MGRQLSVILWVIGIHLLISTGYGSIARQTRSCSGEFKDAVPEIHSLSDSSALGSSVMVDPRPRRSTSGAATSSQVTDLESERQRFNQHVVPQVEARDGGVDLEGLSQHRDPHNVGVRSSGSVLEGGIDGRDGLSQRVGLWPVTESEVPDLESGRQRWSTPGAGTSSQVIDLESRRERARESNQRFIKLGFAILLGSTYAITSISVGDQLSPRNRFISNCVLVINIVSFVSLTAANMTLSVVTPSSTPSTDTHTTQTANTILSTLGLAASAYGFILVIAMGLPDHLLWLIGPALIALVFIFVSTSMARRPRI